MGMRTCKLSHAIHASTQGDKFTDRVMYKETQPNKPTKGFLTSDYSKRDEFSNTVRTAQYRELLTVRGWGDPRWHVTLLAHDAPGLAKT